MNIQGISAAYGNAFNPKRPEFKSVPAHAEVQAEKVEISSKSSDMLTVKSAMEETPEIRLDVVKKIKARIQTNDYPIENNLDEVVKRMLQNNILKPF